MRRIVSVWILLILLFVALPNGVAHAWFLGEAPLLAIDGEKLYRADFAQWWESWREKDMAFPETPDEFIDWHLLAREANQMELYLEPNYQKKVDTFVKARTLLLYKQEEIDSRIKVDDQLLWSRYEAEYCPRWRVSLLYFDDEERAAQALQKIKAGEDSFEKLREKAQSEDGIIDMAEKNFRKNFQPDGWGEVLNTMVEGDVAGPLALNQGVALVLFLEKKGADQEDFIARKKHIRKKEWGVQQSRLTLELLKRLREKYAVEVDEEVMAALSLETEPTEELAEQFLVKAERLQVTAGDFFRLIRKEADFRHSSGFYKGETTEALKKRVLNNLLSQVLTTWAAIDRHYEQEEPFSHVYRFYTRHRLIKELENRLFVSGPPDEAELLAFYEKHLADYTRPAQVSIAVLEDDSKLGEKIWADLSKGADFFTVAAKYYSRHPVVQEVPFEHLEPTVKEVVNGLAVGEVSRPFTVREHTALVKLVAKRPAEPIPFEAVRKEVLQRVARERYNQTRNRFLQGLREHSRIEVNHKTWASIVKDYGEKKSAN